MRPTLSDALPADDETLVRRLELTALLLAGALVGLGLVMWVAANWDDIGKSGRFGLVGGVLAVSAIAAAAVPGLRIPASLTGILAIGGLLALFGQTYQSGADPWQLFALWAALALPWTIAARHDAPWSLWIIVAFAALSLWLFAQVGRMRTPPLELLLPPWIAGGVLVFLTSPWSGLERHIGRTDWTFRLAAVLWLLLITGAAVPAIIDGHGEFAVGAVGLLLAAGLLWLLATRQVRDAIVMSAATLAIDVMLITAVFRSSFTGRTNGFEFLTIGLIAAGIVAASAMGLMKLLRGEALPSLAAASASSPAETVPPADTDTPPWPVAVVSGIGAIFAAIPLLAFVGLFFGVFLEKGLGPYIVGGLVIAAAAVVLQSARAVSFAQQLAFIGLATGLVLLGFGVFRDMPDGMASLVMAAVTLGLAVVVPVGWIRGLLGMAAATFVTMAVATFISSILYASQSGWRYRWLGDAALFRFAWMVTSAATAGVLYMLARNDTRQASYDAIRLFAGGAAVACLLGLMTAAGPTFLLGATISPGATRLGTGATVGTFATLGQAASLLSALAGAAMLWQARADFGSRAGMAIVIASVILSVFAPSLGPVLLLLSAAWISRRPAVTILAIFAALWIIGAFYYWLGWPLTQKAALLVVLGLGIGAAAWLTGPGLPKGAIAPLARPALAGPVAALLILASAAASGGLTAKGIAEKEALITSGKRVFVALAPVDPRSLMQGDYMALRFALPDLSKAPSPQSGTALYALAVVDDRGVAVLSSLTPTQPTTGDNQVAFALAVKGGRWMLGTDAWYFKEGTADTWAKARFGEFRVGKSGDAILVGMADDKLQPIK